jgi:hypothetical protein
MKSKEHLYCSFHRYYGNYNKKSYDPKFDCPSCQRIEAWAHNKEVIMNHISGKRCKEKNHCSYCSEIRHWVRVLKHYGNNCSSKRCPVCEWARHPDQTHSVKTCKSDKMMQWMRLRLYRLLLGIPRKYYWRW